MLRVTCFVVLIIGSVLCTTNQPNGLSTPRDSQNGETQLYSMFSQRGESIDYIRDALLEPSTFVPSASLQVKFVLKQSGASSGFYWYNVDSPNSLYSLMPAGTPVSQTVSFGSFSSDPRYHGGSIGFAINNAGLIHYSQNSLNPVCTACNPAGHWILAVIYQSKTVADAYYIAFEDGPVSANSFGNDGDFNDDVYLVTGITSITPPSQNLCGNGIVESTEQCDGGDCCSSTCTFRASSVVCRASSGPCDPAETCSGSSSTCPANVGSNCVCGNGIVEGTEQCDGGACCTTTCTFSSSSFICRNSAGVCDLAETCSGSSSSCPADSFVSSSVVCRGSVGVCDAAESCSGSSASCPADGFQSSSTVCRASAGVCDAVETCSGTSTSCPADGFQSSSTVCRASVGPCDPAESCSGSSVTCPDDINGSFETACPGLVLPQGTFTDYDVIAFGTFSANTGDVEQRLAVGGNFNVGAGWSVGYQINTDDGTTPYSLLVGGNANFPSGAVYPDGSAHPYNVPEEDIFVGGSFTGPDYLASRVTSCSSPNCLASYFAAGRQCYSNFQQSLAQGSDNVATLVQWSGLYITCNDIHATNYRMTLTASQISSYTWISTTDCNAGAKWVINVVGTDDITFSGGSFPYPSDQVVWNVIGSGRTINIGWTQFEGSILAPNNNVNQPGGVIVGKVIANNINSLQINKVPCFSPAPTSTCGNGVVESGEQCDGGSCCTSHCTYSPSSTVCRAAVSQCDVVEMCSGSSSSCGADVNNGFETSCGGLDFPLAGGDYSFTDFDVIVFGSFNGNTGDVERRLAVKNDFTVGSGYSVGYQIDSVETFVPYALVVGGNANWANGALYPNGQNTPYVAPEEYIFVGGSFTGASSLASLVTGTCGSSSHCLDSYFNAAQSCYGGFQTALANNADNVAHVAQWSTLTVTCNDNTATKYYVTLTASELNSVTSTTLNNCNHDAQWVVNVGGTQDVTFSGGSFFDGASQVVFNVLGSGRTINVGGYQMDGSLLAPYNILKQTGGVIIGKVVVAEVTQMVQMNKYVCYNGAYQPPFYVTDK